MTPGQQKKFIKNLTINNQDLGSDKDFTNQEIKTIEKFLKLKYDRTNNTVKEAEESIYYGDKLSHFEKTIVGVVRSKALAYFRGSIQEKFNESYLIMISIMKNIMPGQKILSIEEENLRKYAIRQFINKYGHIVSKEQRRIYKKNYDFRNTKAAKKFLEKHQKINCDLENLLNYLSFTEKIKSTEEDMKWLHYLLKIIHTPPMKKQQKTSSSTEDKSIQREIKSTSNINEKNQDSEIIDAFFQVTSDNR